MSNQQLNSRLYLKESLINKIHEVAHKLIENFAFFKWMFFKNRPRSSYLLVRSVLVNTLIFGTYYLIFSNIQFLLMGIEVDPILLFVTGVTLGYWNMSASFSSKSQYLSSLYNDIVKYKGGEHQYTAKMLSCNFVAQLLTMDLWGHRLYSWLLVETLTESAQWAINQTDEYSQFTSFENFVEVANSGKLDVGVARNIVIDY